MFRNTLTCMLLTGDTTFVGSMAQDAYDKSLYSKECTDLLDYAMLQMKIEHLLRCEDAYYKMYNML